jgi:TonB family protein
MDPRYPANALDARVQGIVVLKSVLSASGCVTAVKVLASRSPPLDLEALNTVSHWRYRPAELDGERVSVLMSVMVNFKFGY